MNGWKDGEWMDELMDGWIHEWMDENLHVIVQPQEIIYSVRWKMELSSLTLLHCGIWE